jgi:hypothetical protein
VNRCPPGQANALRPGLAARISTLGVMANPDNLDVLLELGGAADLRRRRTRN